MHGPRIGLPRELLPLGWLEAVGFIRHQGVLHVSFPKVYDEVIDRLAVDRAFRTRHLIMLLRVLARLSDESAFAGSSPSPLAISSPTLLAWLDAAAELLEEFRQNGLYWIKQVGTTRRERSGAIDWRRTIDFQAPYFIEEAPLYLNSIRRLRIRSTQDILHRLHASVIEEVALLLTGRGVVEGGGQLGDEELAVFRQNPKSMWAKLARSTFTDRGRRLLQLIRRYFEFEHGEPAEIASGFCLCHTDGFEIIWEHMLRQTIQNPAGASVVALSAGVWVSPDAGMSRGVRPRIDFAHARTAGDSRHLVIFDAKDKHVRKGRRSGSEQDYYKQVVYALLTEHEGPLSNVLIFPTLESHYAESFKPLGSHRWDRIPGSQVHEVAANYLDVCSAFLRRRTLNVASLAGRLKGDAG